MAVTRCRYNRAMFLNTWCRNKPSYNELGIKLCKIKLHQLNAIIINPAA